MVLSCQNIKFDPTKSQKRIEKVTNIFGEAVIKRIICFSLFLLGATRASIASLIETPSESVKTTIRNLHIKGIPAFEDRRRKKSTFLQQKIVETSVENKIYYEKEFLFIEIGSEQNKIKIHCDNKMQIRVLLLTMLNSGMISNKQASEIIKLSKTQTSILSKKIKTNDINILLDNRHGQAKDYKVTSEIKGELIQQFTINAAAGKKNSSDKLSDDLNKRCNINLPARTIRYHIKKLGLSKIRKTLPNFITALKKT